ncbi:hypothetical protein T484DRAFT_1777139 [Baffinella frigidus]|nr:hypothetical protein T484DRAFT_1777139 [Cryptophyta sp. CCMP2293]
MRASVLDILEEAREADARTLRVLASSGEITLHHRTRSDGASLSKRGGKGGGGDASLVWGKGGARPHSSMGLSAVGAGAGDAKSTDLDARAATMQRTREARRAATLVQKFDCMGGLTKVPQDFDAPRPRTSASVRGQTGQKIGEEGAASRPATAAEQDGGGRGGGVRAQTPMGTSRGGAGLEGGGETLSWTMGRPKWVPPKVIGWGAYDPGASCGVALDRTHLRRNCDLNSRGQTRLGLGSHLYEDQLDLMVKVPEVVYFGTSGRAGDFKKKKEKQRVRHCLM